MTSRDYDIIIEMSQSWKSSHTETRTRIKHPCWPFEHTISCNIVLKISSFWLELWEKKHLVRPHSDKNGHFSRRQ